MVGQVRTRRERTAKNPVDPFIDPEGYRAFIDAAEAELHRAGALAARRCAAVEILYGYGVITHPSRGGTRRGHRVKRRSRLALDFALPRRRGAGLRVFQQYRRRQLGPR